MGLIGYKASVGLERRSFIGLSISIFNKTQLTNYIEKSVGRHLPAILYGHSLWTISVLKYMPEIYIYAEKADIFVTDGRPFFLLAKLHGLPLQYDISIPNLVFLTLELANKNSWSVFLLGTDEKINNRAQTNIALRYPNIKKIGGTNGYFTAENTLNVVHQIREFKPNVLLIGTPSPNKEKFAADWKNQLSSDIIIPCGGMLDVLGGKTKVTPRFIKNFGLASLYRLLQEPKRLLKRTFIMYCFLFFNFFPVYLFHTLIKKDKDFSIYKYYVNR